MKRKQTTFAFLLVTISLACSVPGGPIYHPIGTKHTLVAGSIIKEHDILVSEAGGYRSLDNWYRTRPLSKVFTEDRARVTGHTVLRDIPAEHLINLADISQ